MRGRKTPRTAGVEYLSSKFTGTPSATKLSPALRSCGIMTPWLSRRATRIRHTRRMNIANAPKSHIRASITAIRPCVRFHAASPMTPSGAAHVRCGVHILSISACRHHEVQRSHHPDPILRGSAAASDRRQRARRTCDNRGIEHVDPEVIHRARYVLMHVSFHGCGRCYRRPPYSAAPSGPVR